MSEHRALGAGNGIWLSSGSPVVAELAAQSGCRWLLFDLEHGAFGEEALLHNLRAARGFGPELIVRVPTHEAGLIGRALDWGADGIMVPHVETAREARAVVEATRWPPRGRRGYSRSVRATGYGARAPEALLPPRLFAQIESAAGVDHASEIAAVDGVDILFVGPADLNRSLSTTPGAPSYETALATTLEAARSARKAAGILARDPQALAPLRAMGFGWIATASDLAILRDGFRAAARG